VSVFMVCIFFVKLRSSAIAKILFVKSHAFLKIFFADAYRQVVL